MSSDTLELTIEIRFFATLKDKTGTDRVTIKVPPSSTIEEVINRVAHLYPQLDSHLPTVLAAINQEFAFRSDQVSNGDEVALFPPVSGGSGPYPELLSVTEEKLDVDALISQITLPETGAICVFAGAVRAFDEQGDSSAETIQLFYESYAKMASSKLKQVAEEIRKKYPKVQGMAIVQRIGTLNRGETTILVACASGHRNDGCFDAAKYVIDRVKEIVPVWKKEIRVGDAQWIEGSYIPVHSDVRSSTRVPSLPLDNSTSDDFTAVCVDCGTRATSLVEELNCHSCGGAFEFASVPRFSPGDIVPNNVGMWRYRKWLVSEPAEPVTLGEGWTPMVEANIAGRRIYLKQEYLNPTGSFKDRGAAALVTMLQKWQVSQAHDDSSGNAGAALAAYAARAGIHATLFVPESASPQKLVQIRLYEASLSMVNGSRRDAELRAADFSKKSDSFYASHIWNPYSVFAYRTIAYEIWEQLGKVGPDALVLPVGHGTQLLGISEGFADLTRGGLIEKVPRFFGVQSAACASMSQFLENSRPLGELGDTIAEGIRITHPIRGKAVSEAIVRSHGDIILVSEQDIIDGIANFAKMGLLVEPTSAVVWKALHEVSERLPTDARIVASLTGSGQKIHNLDRLVHNSQSVPIK